MPSRYVTIAPGDLMSLASLQEAIIEAQCPLAMGWTGVDCIVGKRVLDSDDQKSQITIPIEAGDLAQIAPLLDRLPPLTGLMNSLEIDAFLAEYRALPNRLSWEPIILTDIDRQRNGQERMALTREHTTKINKMVKAGAIQLVDKQGKASRAGFPYISRIQAVRYITDCGITVADAPETAISTGLNEQVMPEGEIGAAGVQSDRRDAVSRQDIYARQQGVTDSLKSTMDQVSAETSTRVGSTEAAPIAGSSGKKANYFPPLETVTRSSVNTAEAAYYLGRSEQTLRAWACHENGLIRPYRVGRLLAWPVADIRRILKTGH